MLIIDTKEALFHVLDPPPPTAVTQLLRARAELIDLATFVIVQAGDTLAEIAHAAGYPISSETQPWEWVLDHGGAYEAPIVFSDDGDCVVLIVPQEAGIDPTLLVILRDHAMAAKASSTSGDQGHRPNPD